VWVACVKVRSCLLFFSLACHVCSLVSFFTFRWPIRVVVPKLPQYHVMLITSVEILASLPYYSVDKLHVGIIDGAVHVRDDAMNVSLL
jgi:hypothetical protein